MIRTLLHPYKVIKELEEEIENQDKQYTQLQSQIRKIKNTLELLTKDNERLDNTNTELLIKLRNKTKEIKELKRRLKEYENSNERV